MFGDLSYTFFHITLGFFAVVTYGLLQYYIIPEFVEEDKKDLAARYTGYGLTILLSILGLGSVISKYITEQKPLEKTIGGKTRWR